MSVEEAPVYRSGYRRADSDLRRNLGLDLFQQPGRWLEALALGQLPGDVANRAVTALARASHGVSSSPRVRASRSSARFRRLRMATVVTPSWMAISLTGRSPQKSAVTVKRSSSGKARTGRRSRRPAATRSTPSSADDAGAGRTA